jgi:diacylglycerol O-acyltransferase / wax synthase
MKPPAERMSRVDTAWLRMDNDVNLMMIIGVWLLKPAVTIEAMRERIADKLLKYDRFRQKVVHDAIGANWVTDDDFDINRHALVAPLKRRKGQSERAALQQLCGTLATTPLDPTRPLWQFQLIENYEGGSAIIVRIHHCIGDGISLTSVVMSITDGGTDPPERHHPDAEDDPHEGDWLAEAVLKPLTDLTVKAIGMYGSGVVKSIDMLADPQVPLLGSRDMLKTAYQVVNDVAALALLHDDSPR